VDVSANEAIAIAAHDLALIIEQRLQSCIVAMIMKNADEIQF
jgi:hypothetical protein